MLTKGFKENWEVRRYIFYLMSMRSIIRDIGRMFPSENAQGREEVGDHVGVASERQLLLAIARYFYCLVSYDVDGCLLECGCFKGWSTSCLSWACHFLGRQLVVADSFQGLPNRMRDGEQPYYCEGDFKGCLLYTSPSPRD